MSVLKLPNTNTVTVDWELDDPNHHDPIYEEPFLDPYETLGLTCNATEAEIDKAPDHQLVKVSYTKSDGIFKFYRARRRISAIARAYCTLKDPDERKRYDGKVKMQEIVRFLRSHARASWWRRTSHLNGKHGASTEKRYSRDHVGDHQRSAPQGPSSCASRKSVKVSGEMSTGFDASQTSQDQVIPIEGRHEETAMTILKGTLNGSKVQAIADTGAQTNVISKKVAKRLGFKIRNHDNAADGLLRLPNGRQIQTLGTVTACWRFLEEPHTVYEQVLTVLSKCVFDVLIGSPFLKITKTMSANRHRLSHVNRPHGQRIRCVNLVGSPSQRVAGLIDGQPVAALPDSGSELNIISDSYAKRQGWLYDDSDACRNRVMFADGSIDETAGEITLPWTFRRKNEAHRTWQNIRFSILRDSAYDMILGQDFLDDNNAFVDFGDSFYDITEDAQGLSHVIWAPVKVKKDSSSDASRPTQNDAGQNVDDELERLAAADREKRRNEERSRRRTALAEELWPGARPQKQHDGQDSSHQPTASGIPSVGSQRQPGWEVTNPTHREPGGFVSNKWANTGHVTRSKKTPAKRSDSPYPRPSVETNQAGSPQLKSLTFKGGPRSPPSSVSGELYHAGSQKQPKTIRKVGNLASGSRNLNDDPLRARSRGIAPQNGDEYGLELQRLKLSHERGGPSQVLGYDREQGKNAS